MSPFPSKWSELIVITTLHFGERFLKRWVLSDKDKNQLPQVAPDWEPQQQRELSGEEQRLEAAAVTLGYQTSRRNLQHQIIEAYAAARKEKGYDPAKPPKRAVIGRDSKGEISIIWVNVRGEQALEELKIK